MEPYKRLDRKLVKKCNIFELYEDTMEFPNGNQAKWDFIKHKGAAAIVPILEDGRIVMVRQYREAIDAFTLEIPAGGIDFNETMKQCAMRECEEETGYKPLDAVHLLDFHATVAYCNEKIEIYFSKHLVPSKQHLYENEYVNIELYTLDELVHMIYNGEITDGKTIAALTTFKIKLLEGLI